MLNAGECGAAEEVFENCSSFWNDKVEDWRSARLLAKRGTALLGLGRHLDAEPLLVSGYDRLKLLEKQIPAVHRSLLAETAEQLTKLHTATNRPAEAAKWRAERLKYPPERAPPPRPAEP
jgi:hypothetical protein